LVRRAIELAKGDLRAIDFDHVRAISALAAAPDGSGRLQVPGLDVFRSFDWLRLAPPAPAEPRDFEVPLAVPGRAELPAGAVLSAEVIDSSKSTSNLDSVYNDGVGCLNRTRVSAPLVVRNWRPGDRYQPAGYPGEEKVKTLFQRARIPLWERRRWPVLMAGSEIVWVLRFGPSAAYAATSNTQSILRIRYSSE
jgi:tRNA(Ile)-lysidine synthase